MKADIVAPVVGASSVTGNVGSCSVVSVSDRFSVWQDMTVFTNSCTGEIVSKSVYPNQDIVTFLGMSFWILVFGFIAFLVLLRHVSKINSKW